MKQYKLVIIDGLILLVTCVTIVLVLNFFVFAPLKKGNSDSLVTMIQQDNGDRVKAILAEEEFNKMKENKPATFDEYKKMRANKKDEFERTPLMWLAYANNSDKKTTLESDSKRLPMIEMLMAAGADINAVDKDGWTALTWASWSGLNAVATKLVELGADFKLADQKGNTALMIAAQAGNEEIVKILLAKGADRMAQNAKGKTAKDLAEMYLQKFPKKADAYKAVLALLEAPTVAAAVSSK